MYLIPMAWIYVALMMAIAEATNSNGTVLGGVMTFVLYGLLPVGLVVYLMGSASRRKKLKAQEAEELARTYLAKVGLADRADSYPRRLSGGQQQRGAIARVLVQGAQVVLADEPVAALDVESCGRVMRHLVELNESRGVTLLITLHQLDLARRYCHRIVALKSGKIVFDGAPKSFDDVIAQQVFAC